jgi:DNA polymerase-3 subunit delta'
VTLAKAPWLEALKPRLRAAREDGRFPHALLLHAEIGTGAEELGRWIAQLMLCRGASPHPCGQCTECLRVAANQHPDFAWVSPIEDSKQIRVDQIRELAAEFALTSHGSGYKVALLNPADALNINAANALLKALEEPAPETLYVLIAAQLWRLPATVRSRCQRVRIAPPTRAQSLAWLESQRPGQNWAEALELLGNAPFAALHADVATLGRIRAETLATLADAERGTGDLSGAAERWGRGDTAAHLRAIENWISERIRLSAAAHLSESPSPLKIASLFRLLDQTRELVAQLDTPLNRGLGLENLLRSFRVDDRAGRR